MRAAAALRHNKFVTVECDAIVATQARLIVVSTLFVVDSFHEQKRNKRKYRRCFCAERRISLGDARRLSINARLSVRHTEVKPRTLFTHWAYRFAQLYVDANNNVNV